MKFRLLISLFSAFTLVGLMAFMPSHNANMPVNTVVLGKGAASTGKYRFDNPYSIVVDKSEYELKVYDDEGWYATYPIVFGSKDLSDKMREGDKRTPNGSFKVILKKIHPKWGPELLLDYPNDESYERFKDRKARGLLPKNAKIGGGIAIHATRPEEEWTIDNFYNWTDGCVSVKYTEMKDLFSYIPVGTPVTIQP